MIVRSLARLEIKIVGTFPHSFLRLSYEFNETREDGHTRFSASIGAKTTIIVFRFSTAFDVGS